MRRTNTALWSERGRTGQAPDSPPPAGKRSVMLVYKSYYDENLCETPWRLFDKAGVIVASA